VTTTTKALPGTERSFGLSVGGVLLVIAALLWWRGRVMRGEVVGAVGAVLVLLGAVAPVVLTKPRIWWWRGARVVGDFNARVLLTVMFGIVFVPLALVWRAIGKDPLARRRSSRRGWTPYPARHRDRHHYSRMY
jgi:hypothetical protein